MCRANEIENHRAYFLQVSEVMWLKVMNLLFLGFLCKLYGWKLRIGLELKKKKEIEFTVENTAVLEFSSTIPSLQARVLLGERMKILSLKDQQASDSEGVIVDLSLFSGCIGTQPLDGCDITASSWVYTLAEAEALHCWGRGCGTQEKFWEWEDL